MSILRLPAGKSTTALIISSDESLAVKQPQDCELIFFNSGMVFVRDSNHLVRNSMADEFSSEYDLFGDIELFHCDAKTLAFLLDSTTAQPAKTALYSITSRQCTQYQAYLRRQVTTAEMGLYPEEEFLWKIESNPAASFKIRCSGRHTCHVVFRCALSDALVSSK